jgi:hypothetical protein
MNFWLIFLIVAGVGLLCIRSKKLFYIYLAVIIIIGIIGFFNGMSDLFTGLR